MSASIDGPKGPATPTTPKLEPTVPTEKPAETRTPLARPDKPVADGVDSKTGTADIAGHDQTLAKGEAIGGEVLKRLASLAKASGVPGADVAEAGDVDIDVAQGAWQVPGKQQAQTLRRLGNLMLKGDDAVLQRDAVVFLNAAGRAMATAQRQATESLPEGAKVPAKDGLGRALDRFASDREPRTLKIWETTGVAARVVAGRLAELSGKGELRTGMPNPSFDGWAAYGDPKECEWFVPSKYELWGYAGPYVDPLTQGYIGDCYLISTLAALAAENPAVLENMITYDKEKGTYTVEFYDVEPDLPNNPHDVRVVKDASGNPVKIRIEVDPSVLFSKKGDVVGAGVYDTDGDGYWEIGISVLEKAFALYNNELMRRHPNARIFGKKGEGYNGIEGGCCDFVLEALTGENADWDNIPLSRHSHATLLDILNAANRQPPESVMLGTLGRPDNGTKTEAQELLRIFEQIGIAGLWPSGISTTGPLPKADRKAIDELFDTHWPSGLAEGHAYTVLGTCEIDGKVYVVMRNPWGTGEPKDAVTGDKNDGVFMMPLEDVETYYGAIAFDEEAGVRRGTDGLGSNSLQDYVNAVKSHGSNIGVYDGGLHTGAKADDPYVPHLDLVSIAQGVRKNLPESIQGRWGDFISHLSLGGGTDVNALVQWVLREAYMENIADLHFYAQKVRFYNSLKKKVREELTVQRQFLSTLAGKDKTDQLQPPIIPKEFDDTYYGDPETMTSGGELTPAQEAELERQRQEAERQAAIASAIEEYETARKANTATKDVKVKGWKDPGPTTDTQNYAENYGKALVAWYNGLPDDQKAAAREYLEDNGMTLKAKSEEHDGWSGNESETRTVTIPPLAEGADVEAYLMSAASEAGSNLLGTVDGSSAYKWDINLGSGPWGQTVAVPDESAVPMPDILKEIGYVPGAGAPPMESTSGGSGEGWKPGDPVTNKAGLEAYIKNLEEKLSSLGDDGQLANVDLQNILQKQQQTLQMMSNISKTLYDTAMAIARKIGA